MKITLTELQLRKKQSKPIVTFGWRKSPNLRQ
jgi:hypothetical protein